MILGGGYQANKFLFVGGALTNNLLLIRQKLQNVKHRTFFNLILLLNEDTYRQYHSIFFLHFQSILNSDPYTSRWLFIRKQRIKLNETNIQRAAVYPWVTDDHSMKLPPTDAEL